MSENFRESQEEEMVLSVEAQTGFQNLCNAFDKVGRIRSYQPKKLRVAGWIHVDGNSGSELIAQITAIDAARCKLAFEARSEKGAWVAAESLERLSHAVRQD